MENRFDRVFQLKPGEASLVLLLGVVLLGNSLAQKVSEIASISNFLNDVGSPQLLILFIVSSAVCFLTTGLQSLLVDRFNRVTLIRGISFGFALAFVVLRVLFLFKAPNWLSYGFLYLLSEQQLIFFPMVFWILANDIFDISQSKRLFPLLASWGFIGSLIGISITAFSPRLFHQLGIKAEELLMINILLYLILHFLLEFCLKNVKIRKTRQRVETMIETLSEGWNFVREVPIFRYLMIVIIATIICENIIEYHFFSVSESAFNDADSYQVFYSYFAFIRFLSLILLQGLITQRIIAAINLKNTFFILPFSSLVASLCMMTMSGLGGSIAGLMLQKLPQYGIDETARKSFQGIVPEERRGRVSLFMDSYLIAIGGIIGAAVTGIIVLVGKQLKLSNYFYGYLVFAVLSALLAIWAVFRMSAVYDSSLLNWRLKRRQRGKSVLDKLDL
jgi:ATP/ADP translocase